MHEPVAQMVASTLGALRFDIVLLSYAVNSSRDPVHSSRVVSNVGCTLLIQCLMILPNYPRQLRSSAAHVDYYYSTNPQTLVSPLDEPGRLGVNYTAFIQSINGWMDACFVAWLVGWMHGTMDAWSR